MKSRPVIGVTTDLDDKSNLIESAYSKVVEFYGGAPVLIPTIVGICGSHSSFFTTIISTIDGLLIPGSRDMDPKFYGEKPHPAIDPMSSDRTGTEFEILALALEHKIPVLGICGGSQFINVFYGGSIHQDIKALLPEAINHEGGIAHSVKVVSSTVFSGLVEQENFVVKSYHHQAINKIGDGLRASAFAPDGVVEALESEDGRVMAFQWHPELEETTISKRIFTRFISEASHASNGSHAIG